jgi:hypothetical protein
MGIALELTLILVLLALSAVLIPLLIQLRRSARGLDAFLMAARQDLARIADDVHASRMRMDNLGVSVQAYLDEVAGFMGMIRRVRDGVRTVTAGLRSALAPSAGSASGILAGLGAVLGMFRRAGTAPTRESK